ncbi:MAG: protein-L-isoaspartate(D-aspartate) O-methyltransferase [Methyloceanibacter sp.]
MASAQDQIGLIMQLRRRGIRDNDVLRAIERVPRDLFVDPEWEDYAYRDEPLPIACGQTISQPYVVAYMTEKLGLDPRHKVLEIGTGSGYQAAVLSHLCRRVYTVERWRELQKAAEKRLTKLGITNVSTIIGDGWLGWPPQAPFDRIIVTAAAKEPPAALIEQLKVGGRMIIPLGGSRETQQLVQIDKTEAGLVEIPLLPVRFVPLVHGRAGLAARGKAPPAAASDDE